MQNAKLAYDALPKMKLRLNLISVNTNAEKYRPQALADNLGDAAAVSFVIGSDILLDNIEQDLRSLSCEPKETHIGELELSWLKDDPATTISHAI